MMQSNLLTASVSTVTLPPPERGQHGSEIALSDRGGARVRSGLMRLRQDGKIGNAELVAADRWYRDYVFVEYGATCPSLRPSAAPTPAGCMDAKVQAASSYRAACKALGPRITRVLIDVVANETAISKAAPQYGIDRNAFVGVVIASLWLLADYYATADAQPQRTN